MTLFEFSGGSLFSMCFSFFFFFFRVRSHARARARARWMVRCVSTREYKFVYVCGGACLRSHVWAHMSISQFDVISSLSELK